MFQDSLLIIYYDEQYRSLSSHYRSSQHNMNNDTDDDDDVDVNDSYYNHLSRLRNSNSTKNSSMYRVVVTVPGMNASDITIRIEHNDMILHIIGDCSNMNHQQAVVDNRYTIRPNIDINKLNEQFINGVLYVSAPITKTT